MTCTKKGVVVRLEGGVNQSRAGWSDRRHEFLITKSTPLPGIHSDIEAKGSVRADIGPENDCNMFNIEYDESVKRLIASNEKLGIVTEADTVINLIDRVKEVMPEMVQDLLDRKSKEN